MDLTTLLGWSAGLLVTASTGPSIVKLILTGERTAHSIWRDLMQCSGNLLWLLFGILTFAPPLAVMAGLNATLLIILIIQQWVRRSTDGTHPAASN